MASVKTSQRNPSVSNRNRGVSARTIDLPRGTSVLIDSFSSSNGVPTNLKAGAESNTEKTRTTDRNKWRRLNKVKSLVFRYPITSIWCISLPIIGLIIQEIK